MKARDVIKVYFYKAAWKVRCMGLDKDRKTVFEYVS